MNVNNMTKYAVGLLIGLVMIAGLVIPVVDGAQTNAGPKTIANNSAIGNYRLVEADETLTIDLIHETAWRMEVNGSVFPLGSDVNVTLLFSDGLSISKNSAGTAIHVLDSSGDLTNLKNKHITFESGVITLTIPGEDYVWSGEYTWVYVLDTVGTNGNIAGDGTIYVNSINDIAASGYYSTGNNTCYYSVEGGEAQSSGEWETTLTYDIEKVNGTTDIYKVTNLKVHIGDEEFSPFRVVAPLTISGHETGAMSSLLGVIPLVGIICLMVFAASAIRARRY